MNITRLQLNYDGRSAFSADLTVGDGLQLRRDAAGRYTVVGASDVDADELAGKVGAEAAVNQAMLRAVMATHSMKVKDVALLLGKPVKRHSNRTIQDWLGGQRPMPSALLELLLLKCGGAA